MKKLKIFFTSLLMGGLMFVAKPLSVGDKAPDFTLQDHDGISQSLSGFLGAYVVLYFYPMSDTPGCTKQACSLRDSSRDFEKHDIAVLGITYDSPQKLKAFKEKYSLPFTLLSDGKKCVAKQYGAKNWFFLPFPKRRTFVISPEGEVVSIMKDVDVASHTEDVLKIVVEHKKTAKK